MLQLFCLLLFYIILALEHTQTYKASSFHRISATGGILNFNRELYASIYDLSEYIT